MVVKVADIVDDRHAAVAWADPAEPASQNRAHRPEKRESTWIARCYLRPGLLSCIELIVAAGAPYHTPADLKGTRLVLSANYSRAPGAFLTRTLLDLGHPIDQAFFGKVTLRRYSKDAVLDVIKGKADVACIDQGTLGALERFYGLGQRFRTLAISPRYNVDVLYTTANNVATHQTEIELTQQQLTTLGKDPEGQEVLFFFDTQEWHNHREGDLDVPREHFADFVRFMDETPVDLEILLDPAAPVDMQTYDRYGDER